MEPHVLNHEPHQALFVPDDNPLLFYEAITRYAARALSPQGFLAFEINPLYATETITMMNSYGFDIRETIEQADGHLRTIGAMHA
jgi:release factor glutamine methyltransferase